jgi:hypothetical protein
MMLATLPQGIAGLCQARSTTPKHQHRIGRNLIYNLLLAFPGPRSSTEATRTRSIEHH